MSGLAVIVAVAKNGVIGNNNELPWRLRADLQWFKKITTGNTVVMGRKTYESIGRPLPNRDNIVLSRSRQTEIDGCTVCKDIDSALNAGTRGDLFVIGGAELYRRTLPLADRLFLTVVDASVEGDTWLPFVDLDDWSRVSTERVTADEHNQYDCELREYRRA